MTKNENFFGKEGVFFFDQSLQPRVTKLRKRAVPVLTLVLGCFSKVRVQIGHFGPFCLSIAFAKYPKMANLILFKTSLLFSDYRSFFSPF